MPAALNDDELDALAEKLLAKLLARLARREAENDVPKVDAARATAPSAHVPHFRKRTVVRRDDVRPTPADQEFAARWNRRRARKE